MQYPTDRAPTNSGWRSPVDRSVDPVAAHLEDMKSIRQLTVPEERRLLKAFAVERTTAKLGKLPKGPATQRLLEGHLFLVVAIGKKIYSKNRNHVQLADLIGAGHAGLIRALLRFDLSHGCRFGTYATWWIESEMRNEIRKELWPMRIPDNTYKDVLKLRKVIGAITQEKGCEPSIEVIAADLR